MKERILEHHVNLIINEILPERKIEGETKTEESVRSYVVWLSTRHYGKTKGYRFLFDKPERIKFENALIRMADLIKTGSYEIIPDRNADGERNLDFLCQSCGNFTGSDCRIGNDPLDIS